MTLATSPSAFSTALRGSSTNPIWIPSHSERNRCDSSGEKSGLVCSAGSPEPEEAACGRGASSYSGRAAGIGPGPGFTSAGGPPLAARSEEHTSELQSRPHLVCRLLLEKKKTNLTT